MEEKQDGALPKRSLLDKERLRKRFFGVGYKSAACASRRTKSDLNEVQKGGAEQQIAPSDRKEPNDEVSEACSIQQTDDALLERLAVQELLQEAARGKVRADVAGPTAWKKRTSKPNLRFMANSVMQTESQNRRRSRQTKKDKAFI